MIDKLEIRNVKSLRDVRTDLKPFTVFVGPNASGKSSILLALDLLCNSFHGDENASRSSLVQLRSLEANEPIEVQAHSGSTTFRFNVILQGTASDGWAGRGISDDQHPIPWQRWQPKLRPDLVPNSVLLRLEASKLMRPVAGNPDPSTMAIDGTGLHSALASMALNDPDAWQQLQSDFRRIIPTIRRLRHSRMSQGQNFAVIFDTQGKDSLPVDRISEGTLLVLGILTALYASDCPKLILIDDLDRGLHPKAQMELIVYLRSLMNIRPDLQIVATTHSPYMLDCMEPEEVRITSQRDDGSTACAPLSKHPDFEKWKDEMYPGEMWSLFGEKWLAEEASAS